MNDVKCVLVWFNVFVWFLFWESGGVGVGGLFQPSLRDSTPCQSWTRR
jgi:hypothetical protein